MTRRLPKGVHTEARQAGLTPLNYMLVVINDPAAAPSRRDRMAIAAAPYVHACAVNPKKGEKARQTEAAGQAGADTEWADDLNFPPGGRRLRQ